MDTVTIENAEVFLRRECNTMTTIYELQTEHIMKCRYTCNSFNSMMTIIKHPNLAPIIDHGIRKDEEHKIYASIYPQYCSALEDEIKYLSNYDSESSEEWEDVPTKLDVRYKILAQIFDGVYHLHLNNLVHLDIKPTNIMFDGNDFVPVIIDFDTMILCNSVTNVYPRTTHIYAPNLSSTVSPMNDIYAFGIVAYQLLTGTSWSKLPTKNSVVDVATLDYSLVENEEWRRIIKKCLDYDQNVLIYQEIINLVSKYHNLVAHKQIFDNKVEIVDKNRVKELLESDIPDRAPMYLVVRAAMLACLCDLDIDKIKNIVLQDYLDYDEDPDKLVMPKFNIKFGSIFTPICVTNEQCDEIYRDLLKGDIEKWFKNYDPWEHTTTNTVRYESYIN